MPRNGTGTYTLARSPFVPGTVISSSDVNADFSDIATALTGSVAANGETTITGQLRGLVSSSPAFSLAGDTDTGFGSNASDTAYIKAGGVAGVTVTATGVALAGIVTGAIPIGILSDYAGSAAPTGWLLCFGQAISRTTYAALFAIISTTYGPGDGSTTFNLPDYRGRVGAGKDDMGGSAASRLTGVPTGGVNGATLGNVGGTQGHTLTVAETPVITPAGTIVSTDSGHTHATTPAFLAAGQTVTTVSGGGINVPALGAQIVIASGTANITSTFTGTAHGSGGAHNNVQPTIIVNKIIFTGV